jgi:hypothetical protein
MHQRRDTEAMPTAAATAHGKCHRGGHADEGVRHGASGAASGQRR